MIETSVMKELIDLQVKKIPGHVSWETLITFFNSFTTEADII